jgi:hypothetical protein
MSEEANNHGRRQSNDGGGESNSSGSSESSSSSSSIEDCPEEISSSRPIMMGPSASGLDRGSLIGSRHRMGNEGFLKR